VKSVLFASVLFIVLGIPCAQASEFLSLYDDISNDFVLAPSPPELSCSSSASEESNYIVNVADFAQGSVSYHSATVIESLSPTGQELLILLSTQKK